MLDFLKEREEMIDQKLTRLLKDVDKQKFIYNLEYDEEHKCINYRFVYGLNDISNKTIRFTEEELLDPEILNRIQNILLRFSLLKHKTRENINLRLADEYIETLSRSRLDLDIKPEIDKDVLLERIKERKDDIIHYVDSDMAARLALTTLENITATTIFAFINQSIATYLLAYSLLTPVLYSFIPNKISSLKNTYKYNKVVDFLEKEESTKTPALKLYCIVNQKIHELEAEDPKLFKNEIAALKELLEDCYNKKVTNDRVIDLEVIDKIEELVNEANLRRLRKKTIYLAEYKASKYQEEPKAKRM